MNSFSIIIPVKPGGYVSALDHIKAVVPDGINYEILLAEGSAPSRQRNRAAMEAVGDIIYFLDDDSLINPENFALCFDGMNDPTVAVIGGPSITPDDDSWLQQLFGCAISSLFGSGPVRNRYRLHGTTRITTDKELILCNLAIRRSVFIELGGFNECLYPNEENELMERIISSGYKLLHNPSMIVLRSQRHTLMAFIRQMFNYGRGRAQQSLITSSFSVTSFIPMFFVVYLLFSPFCIKYHLLLMPLVVYLGAVLISTLISLFMTGRLFSLFLLAIFPLMHIVNGVGLMWGLLRGKPAPVDDSFIRIRKIKGLD